MTAPQNRSGSPARRQSTAKPSAKSGDPYYGHEETAKMCARFITALFSCPEVPPLPSTAQPQPNGATAAAPSPPTPPPTLAAFIAYALHRTRLNQSVTFCALFLLSRLKARFPAARGSSGHRLFISAFMIASKVVCDDTYSNKSWCVVGQGMFSLREINQMEREMCSYLEWVLNVNPQELKAFEEEVRADYSKDSGLSTKLAATSAIAPPLSTSRPAPVAQHRPSINNNSYPSPESSPPSPSHSDSTSPASSTCHTPPTPDAPNPVPRTKSVPHILPVKPPILSQTSIHVKSAESVPITGPPRIARESSFAFAAPAVW